jgi:hypothetical protein
MRDPEPVARAQRAATRLEPAWDNGAPISFGAGRHAPDQVRDMATELSGRTFGKLPGQVTDQLAACRPGPQAAPDQPPASA